MSFQLLKRPFGPPRGQVVELPGPRKRLRLRPLLLPQRARLQLVAQGRLHHEAHRSEEVPRLDVHLPIYKTRW